MRPVGQSRSQKYICIQRDSFPQKINNKILVNYNLKSTTLLNNNFFFNIFVKFTTSLYIFLFKLLSLHIKTKLTVDFLESFV